MVVVLAISDLPRICRGFVPRELRTRNLIKNILNVVFLGLQFTALGCRSIHSLAWRLADSYCT
jgi:hypothetical protein